MEIILPDLILLWWKQNLKKHWQMICGNVSTHKKKKRTHACQVLNSSSPFTFIYSVRLKIRIWLTVASEYCTGSVKEVKPNLHHFLQTNISTILSKHKQSVHENITKSFLSIFFTNRKTTSLLPLNSFTECCSRTSCTWFSACVSSSS